jgi:hypothetical protein
MTPRIVVVRRKGNAAGPLATIISQIGEANASGNATPVAKLSFASPRSNARIIVRHFNAPENCRMGSRIVVTLGTLCVASTATAQEWDWEITPYLLG